MNIIKNTSLALLFTILVVPSLASAQGAGLDATFKTGRDKVKYTDTTNTDIPTIILKIITFLLTFLAALAVLVILVAGIMYITSGGDEGKVETAKNWIMYAIIGLIIALLGWVIVNIVSTLVIGGP